MSTEYLLGDVGLILQALMGIADEPRQEAESHLRSLTLQNPGEILLLLAQIGAQGVGGFQLDQRLLTLILLKRLAFTDLPGLFLNDSSHHATSPFDVVAERTKARIETVLCAGLKDERDSRMRRGLGTCVASWAQESSSRQRPCMSFPPVLLELVASPDPTFRFTPFQLLDLAPTLLVDSMRDPLPPPQLARMLLAGMNDPSVDVRVEALKAMRSVVMEGLTGVEREQIGEELVHQAFATLQQIPFNVLSHALGPLVDLSSTYPSLFNESLTSISPYLLSLTSPPRVPYTDYSFSPYSPSDLDYEAYEEIANPATEILLSLSELRRTRVLSWEDGRAGKELVGLLTQRLVVALADQGEECRDWLEAEQLDEEDEMYPGFPEESLDRLAMSLGGETILPALSHHVPLLLQESDWRCRYSALMAVASSAEGCVEEFQPRLHDILTLISPSAKDVHPRVRYGFLQCIGQLCQDLDEEVQKRFPNDVLDILLQLLSDPVSRVRAHAGACMVNFFNDARISSVSSLLDRIVKSLLNVYGQGPTYVQEQVFATLSSISTNAGNHYSPYYRQTLDLAISVLSAPPDDNRRRLVGRAMECATITGLSIGKATFSGDAVKIAALLISIQNQVTSSDDPRTAYLFEAWASLCRSLGPDFKPFLPHVLPPLLQAAAYIPTSDASGNHDAAQMVDDNTTKAASTHTAEMEEKVLAFDNLNVYAYTMRSDFEPYLGQCMELSLGALTFSHSEDVREAAAFLIPALLQVAKESNAWKEASEPLHQVFQTVINAIAKEVDSSYLALLFKSLSDSIHVIGVALPHKLSSHLIRACNGHLDDLSARRQDRLAQDEFMDEGDREIYMEEQEEEMSAMSYMTIALTMLTKYDEDVEVQTATVELLQRILQVKSMVLGGTEDQ